MGNEGGENMNNLKGYDMPIAKGVDLKTIIKEAIKEAMPYEPKATLTIAECAEFSGIGRDKLMELAHNQNSGFPCFRVGVKFLINRKRFLEWLDKISEEKKQL